MKINSIDLNQSKFSNRKIDTKTSFTSSYGTKAYEIEKALTKKNIACEFKDNNFVAECVQKTVKIFNELFGEKALPKSIEFAPLPMNTYGACYHDGPSVIINSSNKCFESKKNLTEETMLSKNIFFLPDEKATTHYLRTFIHELGHSAHFNNLKRKNLDFIIEKLNNTKIPNAIGRLITKFKLGKYSATNMNEFMAERITKDIAKNLNDNDEYIGSSFDTHYEDIFESSWNCRYITPQSYIDYFTQQVWNGDIEKAHDIAKQIENYLEALQKLEVLQKYERAQAVEVPVTKTTLKIIERPRVVTVKQSSFIGFIDAIFGKIIPTPKLLERMNDPEIDI